MEQYVTNDILNILDPIRFDNAIESDQYINFLPPSQANLNLSGNPIDIEIQASDKYLHITKSCLYIEGQLVREDNNQPFAENAEISLVNNGMMYMFKDISYSIGDQTMEHINNPGQVTSMIGYLSYPDDYNTSAGLMTCWSKDTTPHADSRKYNVSPAVAAGAAINLGQFTPTENGDYNQGFAARRKWIMSSEPRGHFTFVIPFSHMFGFAEYDKVIYNVKHRLSLTRFSNDILAIHRAQGVQNGKILLTKIIWRVPQIKLEPSALSEIRSFITEKKPIPIHFSGRSCQSTNIPVDVTSHSWKLSVKGGIEKPRWIIVGIQTNKNQSQQQNSAVFDHLNLQGAYVSLNSQKYPATEIPSDFARNHYSSLYKMFTDFKEEYYGFNSLIGGSQVHLATFKTLYPIIVFDVRKQSDELKSGVVDMNLEFQFKEGVPAHTMAYAAIISDRLFKLTSDGINLTMVTY